MRTAEIMLDERRRARGAGTGERLRDLFEFIREEVDWNMGKEK